MGGAGREVVGSLLVVDPAERAHSSQLLQHGWFAEQPVMAPTVSCEGEKGPFDMLSAHVPDDTLAYLRGCTCWRAETQQSMKLSFDKTSSDARQDPEPADGYTVFSDFRSEAQSRSRIMTMDRCAPHHNSRRHKRRNLQDSAETPPGAAQKSKYYPLVPQYYSLAPP